MPQEFRFDAHRFDGRLRKDGRGFVVAPARVTRTGVFTYTRADGSSVRELRHPEDVFAPDHLASLEGASVTVGHPAEHVNPSNVRALEVGVARDARRDGNFVAATLSVRDAAAIAKVERGELAELSLGYQLYIDPTPGVYEGSRYDQRQLAMRVNHIALLPRGGGRAGRDVCLRLDGGQHTTRLDAASTFFDDGQPWRDRMTPHTRTPPDEPLRSMLTRLDGLWTSDLERRLGMTRLRAGDHLIALSQQERASFMDRVQGLHEVGWSERIDAVPLCQEEMSREPGACRGPLVLRGAVNRS